MNLGTRVSSLDHSPELILTVITDQSTFRNARLSGFKKLRLEIEETCQPEPAVDKTWGSYRTQGAKVGEGSSRPNVLQPRPPIFAGQATRPLHVKLETKNGPLLEYGSGWAYLGNIVGQALES